MNARKVVLFRPIIGACMGVLITMTAVPAMGRVMVNSMEMPSPEHITPQDQQDYTDVLPTGRRLSPVGTIDATPNLATQVVAWGDQVAVLANGATKAQTVTVYHRHSLVDLAQLDAIKKRHAHIAPAEDLKNRLVMAAHQDLFQGLAVGPHDLLYAAGGGTNDVLALSWSRGRMAVVHRYALQWQPFPKNQYPYQYQGHHIPGPRLYYPDSLVVGPRDHHLYVTGMLANSLARIDIATGHVRYLNVGSYPFAVILADRGKRLVVSDWGGAGVTVVDRKHFQVLGTVATGPAAGPGNRAAGVHPTALAALPDTADVLVADANIDRIVEINTATLKATRSLSDAPYPDAPPGSYPDGIAVTQGKIFVANAGNNDVAVYDLQTGKPLGLIPTGWYPTALTAYGNSLYVVAGKGLGSGPNIRHQWVGDMMGGLVQRVALNRLQTHLSQWTETALQDDGFTAVQRKARHEADSRETGWLRQHIHYVVFILRENKTFDEDLGGYKAAGHWADPHLDLYNQKELPNLYHLAGTNTLFVNFMADGEVTAQGHQWTTGASDSDFVQRTWPEYYSGRGLVANPGWTQSLVPGGATGTGGVPLGADNPYAIYENLSALGKWSNPWISYPGRLYIFNDLLQHHVPFEDFGEFVSRSEAGNISQAMKKHLATTFPGWDRMILDTDREKMAVNWLKAHPGSKFPHFIYIWLPDDHTAGRKACYYTPDYYVANNDYATAKFIHYLSTTPEWKHMVVFLTEDDAQSGADHINAHRTFALAMGPWVKKGFLESNLYSQVNILKTTEAIFGLPPMSQWDQNAGVFSGMWTDHPDFAPTQVLPMQVPVTFNAGKCTKYTLLRREAGQTGQVLNPDWISWYQAHQNPHGRNLAPPMDGNAYTPTTLLKVPGPEQMKQEWVASKGVKSYARVMAYLRHYARRQDLPVNDFVANEQN